MTMTIEERREKGRSYMKAWRKANPEKDKAWKKANPEKQRTYAKTWHESNKEKRKAYNKAWYKTNEEKCKAKSKAYKEANKERLRICNKVWCEVNKERRNARRRVWHNERYHDDINFRILCGLRTRLRDALNGKAKSARTMVLIGCSIEEVRAHIERQWKPGMTWDNWGKGNGFWNIDHIRPCASFDLRDQAQQRLCFHWSNLQPLWEEANLIKADKWEAA